MVCVVGVMCLCCRCARLVAFWSVCTMSVMCGVHVFSWCMGECGYVCGASLCVTEKCWCCMGAVTIVCTVCSASEVSLWCGCLALVWCLWGFCVCSVSVIVRCMCDVCV